MPGSPLALLAGDALPGGLQGHAAPLQDQRAGHRCKSKPCPLPVSPVPTGRAVPALISSGINPPPSLGLAPSPRRPRVTLKSLQRQQEVGNPPRGHQSHQSHPVSWSLPVGFSSCSSSRPFLSPRWRRSCWGSSASRTRCCGSRRGWCSSSGQRRYVVPPRVAARGPGGGTGVVRK